MRVELIDLIQAMATTNGLWGAERIRGELLKLGIRVSKRTVQKYMRSVRPRGQHGQTWGTFLRNHTHDIWAGDVLQLYDAWFRPIYAFFIVAHGTREVVHVNVTRSPTDAWVAQQRRAHGDKLLGLRGRWGGHSRRSWRQHRDASRGHVQQEHRPPRRRNSRKNCCGAFGESQLDRSQC